MARRPDLAGAGLRGPASAQPKGSLDPSNRRTSIIVQYVGNNTGEGKSSGGDAQDLGKMKPSATGAKAESENTGKKKDER